MKQPVGKGGVYVYDVIFHDARGRTVGTGQQAAAVVPVQIQAQRRGDGDGRGKISLPWFAILFLVVIGFNSFNLLPAAVVDFINTFDTFLLTMAMTALGAETSIDKFKKAGAKPFVLAFILFAWLMGGGYLMAKYLAPLLG